MLTPKSIVASLNVCSKQKDLRKGIQIHDHILKKGFLQKDIYIGSALVSLYAKCGSLTKAQEVFEQLPIRNVVTWSTLIMGYANYGHSIEAIHCYEKMGLEGIHPNGVTFVCTLKACSNIGAIDKGQETHSHIARGLVDQCVSTKNSLVDMYAKCGEIVKAQEVFDEIQTRDVISWTALMSGHTQHGDCLKAILGLDRMHSEGICPNSFTYVCALKTCGSMGLVEKSKEIHARIVGDGLLLESDDLVASVLVDAYAKCGSLVEAREVFDMIQVHDVVSWTALISGYAQNGLGWEALICFEHMQKEGIIPTVVTLLCVLKACGSIGAIDKGEEMHAKMIRENLLESNVTLSSGLVEMYANCRLLVKAQEVFNSIQSKNLFSWTVLITGYVHHGYDEEALFNFKKMQNEGVSPDAFTFVSVLKSCGNVGVIHNGKAIHTKLIKEGSFEKDYLVGNALIDMYAKCGALFEAESVFNKIQDRNVGSWGVLISGYVEHAYEEKALCYFKLMQNDGLFPDAFTFRSILKACGIIGAIEKGEEIHFLIIKKGLLHGDISVGNTLVDMYAKCGMLAKAQEVFNELGWARDVVSWTTLMTGYAQMGEDEIVNDLFNKMISEGIEPNVVTFNVILHACSHQGLLEKGQMYFEIMSMRYGIIPSLEHHACIVDLFGRAGRFHEAAEVIAKLPNLDYLPLWASLLGSCQKWGNLELGKVAFEHAIQLDEGNATAYIYMSNICSMNLECGNIS